MLGVSYSNTLTTARSTCFIVTPEYAQQTTSAISQESLERHSKSPRILSGDWSQLGPVQARMTAHARQRSCVYPNWHVVTALDVDSTLASAPPPPLPGPNWLALFMLIKGLEGQGLIFPQGLVLTVALRLWS